MTSMFDEMSPEERKSLVAEFLSEGGGYLQGLNERLVEAESAVKAGKEYSHDSLNEMFRFAHNIKGMSSFVGLTSTNHVTHEMETVLQKVRNKELAFSKEVIDVLFEAFDVLERQFKSLIATGAEAGGVDDVINKLKSVYGMPKPEQAKPLPQEKKSAGSSEKPLPLADNNLNKKYLPKFIEDAEASIETFNTLLLDMEKGDTSHEKINELFRIVHTIKGSAGLINAARVAAVAHSMENILSCLRERGNVPSEQLVSLLFAGIDTVKDLTSLYKSGNDAPYDVSSIVSMLNNAYEEIKAENAGAATPAGKAYAASRHELYIDWTAVPEDIRKQFPDKFGAANEVFGVLIELEADLPLKSLKVILAQERLKKKGEVMYTSPSPEQIDDTMTGKLSVLLLVATPGNEKDIRNALSIDGISVTHLERAEHTVGGGEPEAKKETPVAAAAPAVPTGSKPEIKPENKQGGIMEEKTEAVAVEKTGSPKGGIELSTIRIDSHKLDNLMNLSGELVIVKARFAQLVHVLSKELLTQKELAQTVGHIKTNGEVISKEIDALVEKGMKGDDKKLAKSIADLEAFVKEANDRISKNNIVNMIHQLDEMTSLLGKISSDIQSGVMQARMVPIEGVFTRFKRIVRDIAKDLSKDVNLVIEGEETELDKKIVDSLGDPLTHMVRNSVDHGLEDAETRKGLGKPTTGTILLRASHKGNSIWIEVKDDGKGIDAERVAQIAVHKNIITVQQAEKMSTRDKLNLIFLPGFSTAEKVTGLSGRGVGMDVVKNMVASVNGLIDIETDVGKGTRFIMKIPLTMAIIKALLVVIEGEIYAFPLDSVTEIVKVPVKDIYSVDGNDVIKLRDHALSLVELQKILGVRGISHGEVSHKKVVVVTDGDDKIGVIVDSLVGEEEIVIKSLPDHFSRVRGVTGASILGDGSISLILDPISIIGRARTT